MYTFMLYVTKNRVSRQTVLNFLKFCADLSSLLFISVFSSVMQYTWNTISYMVKFKNIPRKYLKCWDTQDSSWPWRCMLLQWLNTPSIKHHTYSWTLQHIKQTNQNFLLQVAYMAMSNDFSSLCKDSYTTAYPTVGSCELALDLVTS